MRELIYRRKKSTNNRIKIVCLHEHAQDKDCDTRVHKNFVYLVTRVNEAQQGQSQPEVFIRKSFDSHTQEEKFSFRVRGYLFVRRGRNTFRIDFCHILKIEIHWKNKVFSPKKSGSLT